MPKKYWKISSKNEVLKKFLVFVFNIVAILYYSNETTHTLLSEI